MTNSTDSKHSLSKPQWLCFYYGLIKTNGNRQLSTNAAQFPLLLISALVTSLLLIFYECVCTLWEHVGPLACLKNLRCGRIGGDPSLLILVSSNYSEKWASSFQHAVNNTGLIWDKASFECDSVRVHIGRQVAEGSSPLVVFVLQLTTQTKSCCSNFPSVKPGGKYLSYERNLGRYFHFSSLTLAMFTI